MSRMSDVSAAIPNPPLTVQDRRIDDLHPNPRNPRQHPRSQIKKLAAGIQAHGFLVPILANRAGQVVPGHARLLAARELGLITVPTICLDHLIVSSP